MLCKGRCQEAYENVLDPELIFVPTELRYFIEYEKELFEGRCIQAAKKRASKKDSFLPNRNIICIREARRDSYPMMTLGVSIGRYI